MTENLMQTVSADDIRGQLRYIGIGHPQDSLWINEFALESHRYDVFTIDLRSWLVRGYEIKVSRADFEGDLKWQNYLPHVNYFSFAAPRGMIGCRELPPEVGLVEVWREDGRIRWQQTRRPRLLQPRFVRKTLGEDHLTRLLVKYLRDISWREIRMSRCRRCGDELQTDGRRGGIASEV